MKISRALVASLLAAALVHATVAPAASAVFETLKAPEAPVSEPMLPAAAIAPATPMGPGDLAAVAPGLPTELNVAETLGAKTQAAQTAQAAKTPATATLNVLTGALSKAAPGDAAAADQTIARFIEGRRTFATQTASPVFGTIPHGTGVLSAATPLRPNRPIVGERTASLWRSAQTNKDRAGAEVPKNAGIIAAIGGVVLVIAIIIGVMVHNGHKKNAEWAQSPAAQEIVVIDRARRGNDAETLFKVGQTARARQIADAKQTDRAFDGLSGMRAEENANAVSQDAARRVGGQLPSFWEQSLQAEADQAYRSGSIKALNAKLQDLKAELAKDNAAAQRFSGDVENFAKETPAVGGAMGAELDKARADLNEFNAEVAKKQAAYDQYNGKMRGIVSAKLMRESSDFRAANARYDRLSAVTTGRLSSISTLEDNIAANLKSMADHRQAQKDLLKEADNHHADQVLDGQGHPVLGQDGKPVTVDNSDKYVAKADAEAAAAKEAATNLRSNLEAYNRELSALRADKNLRDEGLSLPATASSAQDLGPGVFVDLLDPDNLYYNLSRYNAAEIQDAQLRFAAARGQVSGALKTAQERQAQQKAAIDQQIDQEIKNQIGGW